MSRQSLSFEVDIFKRVYRHFSFETCLLGNKFFVKIGLSVDFLLEVEETVFDLVQVTTLVMLITYHGNNDYISSAQEY